MAVTDSSADTAPRRRRATAPRTRTGCSTCKQRHVRCDETRPTCNTCIRANKTCIYTTPNLPLRERRIQGSEKLPGQMDPWVITTGGQPALHRSRGPAVGTLAKLVPGRGVAVDPFDMMACSMPFNSKKLLYYFHHANATLRNFPQYELQDCLLLASPDTHALRGTLLLATLHYVWNTGDKETFKSAMYFHKVQSIAAINDGIQKRGQVDTRHGIRLICTLAVSEACLGNVATAQTHLAGLLAAVDELDKDTKHPDGDIRQQYDLDEELTERHFLSSVMFVCFLIQHIADMAVDVEQEHKEQGGHNHHDDNDDVESTTIPAQRPVIPQTTCPICSSSDRDESTNLTLIQCGHKTEAEGLRRRLETIRMLPYFFAPLPQNVERLAPVDVGPTIAGLRQMTRDVEAMRREEAVSGRRCNRGIWLWEKGSATNTWCAMNGAHAESLAHGRKKEKGKKKKRGSAQGQDESGTHPTSGYSPASSSSLSSSSPPLSAYNTTSSTTSPTASSVSYVSETSTFYTAASLSPLYPIFESWTSFNAAASVYMCCVINMVEMDPRFLRRTAIDISSEIYSPFPGTKGSRSGESGERQERQDNDDEADVQLWMTFMGFIAMDRLASLFLSGGGAGKANRSYAWSRREYDHLQSRLKARLRWLMDEATGRDGGSGWSWMEARERLERTVWPAEYGGGKEQEHGRKWDVIWDACLS